MIRTHIYTSHCGNLRFMESVDVGGCLEVSYLQKPIATFVIFGASFSGL